MGSSSKKGLAPSLKNEYNIEYESYCKGEACIYRALLIICNHLVIGLRRRFSLALLVNLV